MFIKLTNKICITRVKLNAQKVFLSRKFTRRDICATYHVVIDDALLETMPDIDQPLLQFIDVINLLDPNFSHIFVVHRFQIRAVRWQKFGRMEAGVSFQQVDCPMRSVSRNTALSEERTRHRSHARQAVAFVPVAPHGSMRH